MQRNKGSRNFGRFQQSDLVARTNCCQPGLRQQRKNVDLKNSQWLVYDLGGGTFDVALVKIIEGELNVIDHEGDNYLGGTDIDEKIVEEIVIPELHKKGSFNKLLEEMKSESGKYNKLWHILLQKSEEAKVELSTRTSAELDLGAVSGLEDDNGNKIDFSFQITRSELESVVKEVIDSTIERMKQILTRNNLRPSDIKFILMVGGSTLIPYVRKRVEEVMGIPINTSIDPTNAVAIGAAYFAGTKEITISKNEATTSVAKLKIRASYNRSSQEQEEVFSAKFEGDLSELQYRITSTDGSFDSGLKKLVARVVEDLPLRAGEFNIFAFKIIDAQGNQVHAEFDTIQIAQGRYSVAGQMLPEDISLVKDNLIDKDTKLQNIFTKNTVLPSIRKITVGVGKSIIKGSSDGVHITIVEGPSNRHSSTNKSIGTLSITGDKLTRDLIRGTDIDLTIEMSESRDLTVSAYLNGTGQEFSQVYVPNQRVVSSQRLASEILLLETKLQTEIDEAKTTGCRDTADELVKVLNGVQVLISQAAELAIDDVTEKKFQLEDKKRNLAQDMYELTSSKRLTQIKTQYTEVKNEVQALVRDTGNDRERHLVSEILAREQVFINSSGPEKIKDATDELEAIRWEILARTPDFLKGMFHFLLDKRASMNDQIQATQLFENGKRAVERDDFDGLRQINARLWDLIPSKEKDSEEYRAFTGII
jgi:molecular chaperone DnaK